MSDAVRSAPCPGERAADRDVEALLTGRGVIVTDETVRQWCRTFGQQYVNALRCRRPRSRGKWHLDELFVSHAR